MNSSTGNGLRVILRARAIPAAEIAWRWSFGFASFFLSLLFVFEYLNTLPVNAVSRFLLGTGQPVLIARALHRIFSGSAYRFTKAGVLLAIGLTLLWIISASLGRLLTVHSIAHELGIVRPSARGAFLPLAFLNFLRAAVLLAAAASTFGSALIASSFWVSTRIPIAEAGRLFAFLFSFTFFAWILLNWLLSLAGALCVINRQGAVPAITSAVALVVEETGPIVFASIIFGVLHTAAFIFAVAAAVSSFALLGGISPGLVLLLLLLIAMIYSAVADFLFTGRLVAYLSLLQDDALSFGEEIQIVPAGGGSIDKSELILSDLPAPAM